MKRSAPPACRSPRPPWIEFPDPAAWTDWIEPAASRWFNGVWWPYWQSLSLAEKMAYEAQWRMAGGCFHLQLSWAWDCARRTRRAYAGVTDTVAQRRLHRWTLGLFGREDDRLGPALPFPLLPADDYALPPPWLCMFGDEDNLPLVMRYGTRDSYFGDIWLAFWQTLDAAQRRAYLARWPRNAPWERFLVAAGDRGLLVPHQDVDLESDSSRRLVWEIVDAAYGDTET